MNQGSGRSVTENTSNKRFCSRDRSCGPVHGHTADNRCDKQKSDGQHRLKRLRSRKARSQRKGGGKEAPESRSHHNHCQHPGRRDFTYLHERCCHRSCRCTWRGDAPPLNVPAAQEPSIITIGRLTGRHGLFNHEVKSIDIERLSYKSKMETTRRKNTDTCSPIPTSRAPSPILHDEKLEADADKLMSPEKSVGRAVHDDCQEKQEQTGQEADLTPGLRTKPVVCKNCRESQLTPTDCRENVKAQVISSLELTPKNPGSPALQTQDHACSPGLPPHFSSRAADSFESQPDPNSLSESISEVASRLSDGLRFPPSRRSDLLAESREELLKAARERHGPQLQENLLRLQRCLSADPDPTEEVQVHQPIMREKDKLQSLDAFLSELNAGRPSFHISESKAVREKGSGRFHWKSSPQLLRDLKQPAEWLRPPKESCASILDDVLGSPCSARFCMDFEATGTGEHFFTPSSSPCWAPRTSTSPPWVDGFHRSPNRETFTFNYLEQSLMNQTRAADAPQCVNRRARALFPHQALPPGHLTEPLMFPNEPAPFGSTGYSFSPRSVGPEPSHGFLPFSQLRRQSLGSHQTDMIHFPPSEMLERDPARSRSSLLSPEPWAFPPMRLY